MNAFFWKQYEDLPAGIGYGRFSPAHFCALAVIAAAALLLTLWFRRQSERTKKRVLAVIPPLMLLMEAGKDLFLWRGGHFGVGYLPLHLCGLGVFVFLLTLVRSGAARDFFGEVAVTLILPGSVAALIFPDWAHLYPMWNFMNLHGYVWHGLLVLYPLLLLSAGRARPDLRHIWYDPLFLLCVVPPVYLFDRAFHCNYMFVNWPPPGTPLMWIADRAGEDGYLLGYAAFALAVIGGIYLIIYAVQRVRRGRGG